LLTVERYTSRPKELEARILIDGNSATEIKGLPVTLPGMPELTD
jgi:hypothetical protein